MHNVSVYIFDFCGFKSVAYTKLNKLLTVFLNICSFTKNLQFQVVCFSITISRTVYLVPKRNSVTTSLTFQDHVTSWVT